MLVPDEARTWAMSFATCAIEGNTFAIYMTELWNRNKKEFMEELEKFITDEDEE